MLNRLLRNVQGVAAVEFAICVPVLLIMFMGSVVITDMVSCNRKVTIATRALADLISHNLSPTAVQANPAGTLANSYLSASALVMNPYDMSKATQTASLLRVCDATHAFVVWSQTMTQDGSGTVLTSPVTVGAPAAVSVVAIPANMVMAPLIPLNPDGSTGICTNYSASNSTRTQVGQAGGYLLQGQVSYLYAPAIGFGAKTTTQMADAIYMSPRLY